MDTYIQRQRFWSQTSHGEHAEEREREKNEKQKTRRLHSHRLLIPTRIIFKIIFIAKLCDSDTMLADRQFVRKWNGIINKRIRLVNGKN